ncbi:hypothetical protein LWI29_033817 [Acer saccharum]|uniref:Uncharacterized protein n=1 Tax=Acer saccharum TaxID=4024 RepID=A0AA39SU75_ACESA|nr:hypothetical protein LWI29_033817 [Acer saccharum]
MTRVGDIGLGADSIMGCAVIGWSRWKTWSAGVVCGGAGESSWTDVGSGTGVCGGSCMRNGTGIALTAEGESTIAKDGFWHGGSESTATAQVVIQIEDDDGGAWSGGSCNGGFKVAQQMDFFVLFFFYQ